MYFVQVISLKVVVKDRSIGALERELMRLLAEEQQLYCSLLRGRASSLSKCLAGDLPPVVKLC